MSDTAKLIERVLEYVFRFGRDLPEPALSLLQETATALTVAQRQQEEAADALEALQRRVERMESRTVEAMDDYRRQRDKAVEALRLIAAERRPDGTYNRDREACRELAAATLSELGEDA